MSERAAPVPDDDDPRARAWRVARRLEEFRGEERANVARIVGVALFYLVEVVNRHGLDVGPIQLPAIAGVDELFHGLMTAIALAWVLVAAGVLIALRNRLFPRWLKYATTAADLVLATAVLAIADGPQSPLVVIYFPILALTTLRFGSWLVQFATAGTIVSYLSIVLLADRVRPALAVPRYHSVLVVLALALVGLVLAYAVTSVRRVAAEYAARAGDARPDAGAGEATAPAAAAGASEHDPEEDAS